MDASLFGSTAAEQLKNVEDAIYKVLVGGQRYRIGTRELYRGNLDELRRMRQMLMAEAAAADNNSLFSDAVVAVFDGR